jgi:hypothetical protein
MKTMLACSIGLTALLIASTSLSAKGLTIKITINGARLVTPIEIDDATVIAPFQVWAGPGTKTCVRNVCREGTEGFIVNWSSGFVTEPPAGLQRYEVTFYASEEQRTPDGSRFETLSPRIVYIVLYVQDASTGQGYVYLPTGTDDERYGVNTSSIYRGGLERHWFRATDSWDSVAAPLVARGVR